MAFEINRTGLDSSQKYLDVTSNNIANASSYGFKLSRAQFADVYATSDSYTAPIAKVGGGSLTASVQQIFKQGFFKQTDNLFDLSIDGEGFFTTSTQEDIGDRKYTRAGAFQLNKDNQIVNAYDDFLLAYSVDQTGFSGNISENGLGLIDIPTVMGDPEMTENIALQLNFPVLDSDKAKRLDGFDPKDSDTYNFSTGTTFYDSLGQERRLKIYYVKPSVQRPTQFVDDTTGNITASAPVDIDASFDFFDPLGIGRPDDPTVVQPDLFQDHQLYMESAVLVGGLVKFS